MPEASPPRGGLLPKAPAAGPLRVLARMAVDAVLYVFLAALWANNFVGTVLEILGRWVCGEGSSVEAAGLIVRACSKFVMVLLGPAYIMLVLVRVSEHAEFDLKEQKKERRKKEKVPFMFVCLDLQNLPTLLHYSEGRINLIGNVCSTVFVESRKGTFVHYYA